MRPERPDDAPGVASLLEAAFDGPGEARLVEALRHAVEPYIALVAADGDELVGHVVFTPVEVERAPAGRLALALGPMAVRPGHQRQGVGGLLVEAGLAECRRAGAAAVFVVGHADYYPRFGFTPASFWGLRYLAPEYDPHFMVLELEPGALADLEGEVRYPPAFEAV